MYREPKPGVCAWRFELGAYALSMSTEHKQLEYVKNWAMCWALSVENCVTFSIGLSAVLGAGLSIAFSVALSLQLEPCVWTFRSSFELEPCINTNFLKAISHFPWMGETFQSNFAKKA